MQISRHSEQGFTLIEMMIVIVIIGILSTLVIQAVGDRPDQAREVKLRNDLITLESAVKLYRLDTFDYPSTAQGLQALITNPQGVKNWRGPYIDRLPRDPWDQPYKYNRTSKYSQDFDIFTLGRDGIEGGTGPDLDFGNWSIE